MIGNTFGYEVKPGFRPSFSCSFNEFDRVEHTWTINFPSADIARY